MSCKQYESDLSRALDGRLPATRRAEVMQHLQDCADCQLSWQELQAAQRLVFNHLPEPRVAPGFRDEVWTRIRAGEGAPEITLQEPVSVGTKLRYGLVGAAAAAALLFFLHNHGEGTTPSEPQEVAERQDPRPAPAPKLVVVEEDRETETKSESEAEEKSFGPGPGQIIAQQAVDKVASASRNLRQRAPQILNGEIRQNRGLFEAVQQDIFTIDKSLLLLDGMVAERVVRLDDDAQRCIAHARATLSMLQPDRVENLPQVVNNLTSCSLETLPRNFSFYPYAATPGLQRVLQRFDQHQLSQLMRILQPRGQVFILKTLEGAPKVHFQLRIERMPAPPRPRDGARKPRSEGHQKR